ncbi:hypothetical protein [Lederbergia graminis]|uniref:Uncharacterized protein n=1 Tax=Lederbergia graminis TaxID=735518 RepID=A0ABW0LHD6_9BACI|nr:hypothetical protein [Paenibacillus bovis]HLU21499.1 hypothetical protein [Bacillaceae bacterium]
MSKQQDKHQFEYTEKENEQTIQQISDMYIVGGIEQQIENNNDTIEETK